MTDIDRVVAAAAAAVACRVQLAACRMAQLLTACF